MGFNPNLQNQRRKRDTEADRMLRVNLELRAENARLREALTEIADVIQGGDKLESLEGWARDIVEQARDALGSKP